MEDPNTEMRIDVLERAVSILFRTHPDPTALKDAWAVVLADLDRMPRNPQTDVERRLYDQAAVRLKTANALQQQIGQHKSE